MPFAATRMDLQIVILHEGNQRKDCFNCYIPDVQLEWLAKDIDATDKRCFIFTHAATLFLYIGEFYTFSFKAITNRNIRITILLIVFCLFFVVGLFSFVFLLLSSFVFDNFSNMLVLLFPVFLFIVRLSLVITMRLTYNHLYMCQYNLS